MLSISKLGTNTALSYATQHKLNWKGDRQMKATIIFFVLVASSVYAMDCFKDMMINIVDHHHQQIELVSNQ